MEKIKYYQNIYQRINSRKIGSAKCAAHTSSYAANSLCLLDFKTQIVFIKFWFCVYNNWLPNTKLFNYSHIFTLLWFNIVFISNFVLMMLVNFTYLFLF